ncbi:leucine-rich repeat domain, L domain-like protein [Artemisia annua]|uniref:Leucine-rich repeat domain, L domain-like protein n=1 Tax=Artemisia annua TaxID=35608 RepID=A0A2U1KDJ6_ARTAN|nr:leucine-rich repeat domain, L domain-like protein [Artemisia annua]
METTKDEGGENGKRICTMTLQLWLLLMIMATIAQAQNTTDPAEARIINEMFSGWGIEESTVTNMGWNISGELCSGAAVDSTDFDSDGYNPAIKCDCNFPNSTCHITRLPDPRRTLDFDLSYQSVSRIINEMFSGWGIEESTVTNMGWNISGELCSGAAVDSTDFDSDGYNPAIKCDCNFPNSTCHITRL